MRRRAYCLLPLFVSLAAAYTSPHGGRRGRHAAGGDRRRPSSSRSAALAPFPSELLRWIERRGGRLPSIALTRLAPGSTERGVTTTTPIAPGAEIARVPRALFVTASSGRRTAAGAALAARCRARFSLVEVARPRDRGEDVVARVSSCQRMGRRLSYDATHDASRHRRRRRRSPSSHVTSGARPAARNQVARMKTCLASLITEWASYSKHDNGVTVAPRGTPSRTSTSRSGCSTRSTAAARRATRMRSPPASALVRVVVPVHRAAVAAAATTAPASAPLAAPPRCGRGRRWRRT